MAACWRLIRQPPVVAVLLAVWAPVTLTVPVQVLAAALVAPRVPVRRIKAAGRSKVVPAAAAAESLTLQTPQLRPQPAAATPQQAAAVARQAPLAAWARLARNRVVALALAAGAARQPQRRPAAQVALVARVAVAAAVGLRQPTATIPARAAMAAAAIAA